MSPRVIAMEADIAELASLHDTLASAGYRVACASSPALCLRAIRQESPALIILALGPDTAGADWLLLPWLQSNPATAATPLLGLLADRHGPATPRARRALLGRVAALVAPPKPCQSPALAAGR